MFHIVRCMDIQDNYNWHSWINVVNCLFWSIHALPWTLWIVLESGHQGHMTVWLNRHCIKKQGLQSEFELPSWRTSDQFPWSLVAFTEDILSVTTCKFFTTCETTGTQSSWKITTDFKNISKRLPYPLNIHFTFCLFGGGGWGGLRENRAKGGIATTFTISDFKMLFYILLSS